MQVRYLPSMPKTNNQTNESIMILLRILATAVLLTQQFPSVWVTTQPAYRLTKDKPEQLPSSYG